MHREKYNPVPGAGILDYPLFFELLKTYKPHTDISREWGECRRGRACCQASASGMGRCEG